MNDLLAFILKHLVDHPADVVVDVSEQEGTIVAALTVHQDDTGRVIGKEGKTINAIRSLAKVLAAKEKKKLVLTVTSSREPTG